MRERERGNKNALLSKHVIREIYGFFKKFIVNSASLKICIDPFYLCKVKITI